MKRGNWSARALFSAALAASGLGVIAVGVGRPSNQAADPYRLAARGGEAFGSGDALISDIPREGASGFSDGSDMDSEGGIAGDSGGACCLESGGCVQTATQSQCNAMGGIFLPGENCSAPAPGGGCGVGACCSETNCVQMAAYPCIASGRTFMGAGTQCADDPCGIGVGACCVNGSCSIVNAQTCASMGGTFQGPGTVCAGQCAIGACCMDEVCVQLAQFECLARGGVFTADTPCDPNPCIKPNDCPANSLFSQSKDTPADFIAGTSEESANLRRFENFSGVAGPIEGLVWWGLDLDFVGAGWVECVEFDPTFDIRFYEDAGGFPGALVCSYNVTATRTELGVTYLGAELNEYAATLPEPCVLVNGWVSIVGLGGAECLFLWMSSGGDSGGYSICDNCLPSQQEFDLSVCLLGTPGGVLGACCNEQTGVCMDNVEIDDCIGPNLRFEPNATCAELDPPCGVILGACCFADATCTLLMEEECAKAKGNWLGAHTRCDQCPCLTPCPPGGGGIAEGEPQCDDFYVDEFNGGCTSEAQAFSTIAPGQTICGENGVFSDGSSKIPDFDWYQVTITQPTTLTWTVKAEFRPRTWIVDGNGGCEGKNVLATDEALECDTLTISAPVEPGVYWLVVAAAGFTDSSTCGTRYVATLPQPCPADVNLSGEVNIDDLFGIIGAWGTSDPQFDIAPAGGPNGVVDIDDLFLVIGAWGPCS